MNQFPILVEHGPVIWRAIQISFVVVLIVAILAFRWWIARTALRDALRRLRSDHGAIRGVLRGGGATTVSVESAGPSVKHGVASWRADTLRLETADRTIELVGEVRVIGGSRFDARRRRLPRLGCRDAIEKALPWSTGRIHGAVALHLAPGDEIEVRGTPQPFAGQGETTPRDADIAWSMHGDEAALELSAIRPVSSRLPLGIVRIAIIALASFGASVGVLRSCGEGWESECGRQAHDGERFIELDNGHACVLAASTPKLRERGLRELFDYLHEDPYRDEPSMSRLDALAREIVGCDQLPISLLREGRYDTALAEARRCGDLRVEHEALVALGYFAEAAALRVPATGKDPALPILTTLIAASRWTEAATALRADQNKNDCLAAWFAQLGGDATVAKRLSSEDCAPLRKELDPASRTSNTVWLLEPESMLVRPESAYDALELWLPIDEKPDLVNRAIRLRQRAVKQVLDNDTDSALATAREVEELSRQILDRNDRDAFPFVLRAPAVLTPALQLYTPVVFGGIAERFVITEQRMMESSKRITGDADPQSAASLRDLDRTRYARLFARSAEPLTPDRVKLLDEISVAAREGKLERVMAIVQDRRFLSWDLVALIAVLPHIPSLHARLARELPHVVGRSSSWSSNLAAHALDAFAHRELLEAVGATAAAGYWDAIYRRYDTVLRDPTHVRALALRRYY